MAIFVLCSSHKRKKIKQLTILNKQEVKKIYQRMNLKIVTKNLEYKTLLINFHFPKRKIKHAFT